MGRLIFPTCLQNYKKTNMIISVINQKGGVAKTTSTFNIAGNLVGEGYKVLQIDIYPQASLTIANGIEPEEIDKSIYDVLCEGTV